MPPGSFAWLLAHDVRLNWRRFADMLGGASPRLLIAIFLAGGVALHLAAWPVVKWLSPHIHGSETQIAPLAALIVCTFSWMVAQSLFGATRALFDRGDLDLLLGSPLPAQRVFAAKAAGIAASTFGSIAFLTLPIANAGALIDRPAWLGLYPALIALALIAAALGIGLAIVLFFLFGPRRARVYTQMTGAVIGGAFILAAQVVAMLPAALRTAIVDWFEGAGQPQDSGTHGLLSLPINAVRGDTGAMILLVAAGMLLFALTVRGFGERFGRASLAAVGTPSGGHHDTKSNARFRSGLGRNLRRKEWRLLARDPSLFAQLGLQIIYTIPIAVVLLHNESLPAALALAPTIVVVAAQVAASLAWITVSGEDAPELIASAPVALASVDRAKLSAVALPVVAIVALPLAGLAMVSLPSAMVAALFAAAAATSTALLNFWHPMPGNRRGMLRRHSQSKLIGLVEHGLAVLWAIAIVLAMIGTVFTALPIAVAGAVLLFCRSKHRKAAVGSTPGQTSHAGSSLLPASAQP